MRAALVVAVIAPFVLACASATPEASDASTVPAAEAATPESNTANDPDPASASDPFAVVAQEGIGGVRIDMPASELVALLGEPSDKSEISEPGPNGELSQTWTYADADLNVLLTDANQDGEQVVGMIELGPNSKLETGRGIGIGSNRAKIATAYADLAYDEETGEARDAGDPDGFTAGSMSGQLWFVLEDDAVTAITLSPAAE